MEIYSLEEALIDVAEHLELSMKEMELFMEYRNEDAIGGYHPDQKKARWPVGSIFAVEGRFIYTLVRHFKPDHVYEIGSFYGCSASHIMAAMVKNKKGKLTCIDVNFSNFFCKVATETVPVELETLKTSGELFFPPTEFDMLFEDGPHTVDFTETVLRNFLPKLRKGGIALCHDYFHFDAGQNVKPGFDRATLNGAWGYLIEPSDCGIGFYEKQTVHSVAAQEQSDPDA